MKLKKKKTHDDIIPDEEADSDVSSENEEDYLAVLAKYNLRASDLPPWGSQKRAQGGNHYHVDRAMTCGEVRGNNREGHLRLVPCLVDQAEHRTTQGPDGRAWARRPPL